MTLFDAFEIYAIYKGFAPWGPGPRKIRRFLGAFKTHAIYDSFVIFGGFSQILQILHVFGLAKIEGFANPTNTTLHLAS